MMDTGVELGVGKHDVEGVPSDTRWLRPEILRRDAALARVVGVGRFAPSPDGGRGRDSPLTLLPAAPGKR